MIHSLRRAHRAIWVALAILLPLFLALALLARPERPLEPRVPDLLQEARRPAGRRRRRKR